MGCNIIFTYFFYVFVIILLFPYFLLNLVHVSFLSMFMSFFSTVFSYHLIFPFLKNLFTPWVVLNLFLYFLGNTILKNISSQLFVLGMFLFSMCDNVLFKSLPNLVMNFAISSGKCFIWLFSMLYLSFAFFKVFWLNILDIRSL